MTSTSDLIKQIEPTLASLPIGDVGIAVSGGGDSVALLHLMYEWVQGNDHNIYAATVNHNLRSESLAEAEFVAGICKSLGVPHQILDWDDWDGQGNLQSVARDARKVLLYKWAQKLNLSAVILGHTKDDQAETFLMRLARGSGVDGLSGMQAILGSDPMWVRPMLDISRGELRDYLVSIAQSWIDDPSNDDAKFDRVKIRKSMPSLEEIGLGIDRLSATAKGLHRSRMALEEITQDAARKYCTPTLFGTVTIDIACLQEAPLDIQYRLFSYALGWVSGNAYRPRFAALETVFKQLKDGNSQTLTGCYIKVISENQIIVMRELASLAKESEDCGQFDGRWQIVASGNIEAYDIRPIGEKGLLQLENWRNLEIPREVLMQTPAAWKEGVVTSAPLAGLDGLVHISLKKDINQFYEDIVSH